MAAREGDRGHPEARDDVLPDERVVPAFAVYQREPGGAYHAHAVLVPTVTATGIARIIAFQDPGLFGSFGLPQEYRAGSGPAPAQD